MKYLTERTKEIRLYIGSRVGYHGKEFNEEELIESIGNYQTSCEESSPVRVTKTRYVDEHYNEPGWEIVAICYPRKPRTGSQLKRFMKGLAHHLLQDLKQMRVTLIKGKKTTVFEMGKLV